MNLQNAKLHHSISFTTPTYLPTSFGPISNKGFVSMTIKLTQHSQHDVIWELWHTMELKGNEIKHS